MGDHADWEGAAAELLDDTATSAPVDAFALAAACGLDVRPGAATAWSLERLRERHVNASATALAIRITQVRGAVTTLIDPRGRKRPWRRASPWIVDARLTACVSRWEHDLAREAWEARAEVRGDELCYAVPILDDTGGHEDRVVVVCELEQLSMRLG